VHANPLSIGVRARALAVSQSAGSTRSGASGYEKAHIARVSLGSGLVLAGINAQANVSKDRSGLHRNARGTSLVRVRLNGVRQTIPANGVLRLRGLALIETRLVHKIKGGIAVTAVRVTLLDGRGAVLNLGYAKFKIRPSGL
jgi:hypothetical protein